MQQPLIIRKSCLTSPSGKFSSQIPVSATVPSNSSTSYSHDPNKVPSKISKQGIGMLSSPSSVTIMLSLEPTTISLFRVTCEARVTVAPVCTITGNGSIEILSRVAGSGLPSQKPYSTSVGG